MAKKSKSGKADRNRKEANNLAYKAEKRHEKSHVRRLTRHMERFPNDKAGAAALKRYSAPFSPSEIRKFL